MKRFEILVFLVLVFGCSDFEGDDYIPIEKRKIVGQIHDEIAYLGVERISADKFGFVFELQNPGDFKFLSVLDSDLICGKVSEINCISYHQEFFFKNYERFWYRISGVVKEFSVEDGLSGHPFEVSKAERILSCPIKYKTISGEVPLENVLWKFIGFIDESGMIYSHPTCELNLNFIKFKTYETSNSKGYLEVPYYGWTSFSFMRGFTILSETKKIALTLIPVPYDPPRSPNRSSPKMDSLAKVIDYDTIDYVLENNTLKLLNPRSKLNAMFVAN